MLLATEYTSKIILGLSVGFVMLEIFIKESFIQTF